jgi:hypothetical protein
LEVAVARRETESNAVVNNTMATTTPTTNTAATPRSEGRNNDSLLNSYPLQTLLTRFTPQKITDYHFALGIVDWLSRRKTGGRNSREMKTFFTEKIKKSHCVGVIFIGPGENIVGSILRGYTPASLMRSQETNKKISIASLPENPLCNADYLAKSWRTVIRRKFIALCLRPTLMNWSNYRRRMRSPRFWRPRIFPA